MKNLKELIAKSDMFSHIPNIQYLPRWVVLLIDVFLCVASYFLSYYLSHKLLLEGNANTIPIGFRLLMLLILQIASFWIFHTYSGVLRYSGYIDLIKVVASVLLTTFVAFIINIIYWLSSHEFIFYNWGLLLYVFIACVFLFSLRMLVKTTYEYLNMFNGSSMRIMIYGTQSAGVAIGKMLRSAADEHNYKLVGFIEDETPNTQRIILGEKVYKKDDNLIFVMQKLKVQGIIISPLKIKEINPNVDLDLFINNNIAILAAPYISVWKNGDSATTTTIGQIKSIQIEDLLERPSIQIDLEHIEELLKDNIIMITGAAGSIGSELVRQIVKYHPRLIVLLDQAESPLHDLLMDLSHFYPNQNFAPCIADVRNQKRINEIVDMYRPEIIYHAAAYKHVPLMEDNPSESIQANVLGTKNIADAAVKFNVKRFVMVSTDKAVNPTNIMGATKRIAEIYVQSLFYKLGKENPDCTKFITTRFGNVLGSNGSVIPYFKKQIEQGGPVTVTHPEIIRYFMTIPEACQLVLEAALIGKGGEIYIFDMGKPVKILDLAKKMIRLAGYKPGVDIKIAFTGLRPGEKLYEELLNKKEKTMPTNNEKIMIAKVQEFEYDEISSEIETLINYSYMGKTFLMVSQMKKIVPEYISKNSPYEKLDI